MGAALAAGREEVSVALIRTADLTPVPASVALPPGIPHSLCSQVALAAGAWEAETLVAAALEEVRAWAAPRLALHHSPAKLAASVAADLALLIRLRRTLTQT